MAIEDNLSRSGQNNATGPDRVLFEKKMQTDVLRYFQVTNIFKPLVTNKTIANGKSASFPVVGNASAHYHVVGTELEGETIRATEREITIDDILVADTYIPDIDQAMVHYDAKSAYNESLGRSLAKKYDEDLARMIAIAGMIENSTDATAAGLLAFTDDVYTAVQSLTYAGDELDGQKVYNLLIQAKTEWDEKDIVGDPVIVLRPQQYYALLNNPANTGMTWVNDPYRISGKVPAVLGHAVYRSPHIPTQDDTSNADVKAKYQADFSNVIGMMFAKEAVGALHLLELSMRSDYIPQRLADLAVAKMLVGFGILNHSAAITLKKSVTPVPSP